MPCLAVAAGVGEKPEHPDLPTRGMSFSTLVEFVCSQLGSSCEKAQLREVKINKEEE